MEEVQIPKGDYGYDLEFTVQQSDGTVKNLTGYTIILKVWSAGAPGTTKLSGSCDIDVAGDGTCYYTVQDGDFDRTANYYAELQLTKDNVVESSDRFRLYVTESPS